jgi:hypothetical protein
LELVCATLFAMPIFSMRCLDLPAKTLIAIKKIIRGFLYKGRKDVKGAHCLVAWEKVCAPNEWGGFGVPNLKMMNLALRTGWLWLQRVGDSKPWKELHIQVPKMVTQISKERPTPWWEMVRLHSSGLIIGYRMGRYVILRQSCSQRYQGVVSDSA